VLAELSPVKGHHQPEIFVMALGEFEVRMRQTAHALVGRQVFVGGVSRLESAGQKVQAF
jgi:hypothetical protein